jgi:hypothetical protein
MSHTVKHTPTSAVCTVRAGAGRRFKRLQHKRERALVRIALAAGAAAHLRFTPAAACDLGHRDMCRRNAPGGDFRI